MDVNNKIAQALGNSVSPEIVKNILNATYTAAVKSLIETQVFNLPDLIKFRIFHKKATSPKLKKIFGTVKWTQPKAAKNIVKASVMKKLTAAVNRLKKKQ
eukprot:11621527-Karenia_brevis.AAC.1